MPAVVISTDVSQSGGTSEPLGSRTCPRCSKKLTNRSRISSDRMGAILSTPLPPPCYRCTLAPRDTAVRPLR